MIEVNLFYLPSKDAYAKVGKLVARSRFDKDSLGVGVMQFVKGFLKNNLSSFESALGNTELVNLINNDVTITTRDLACINYYLVDAGFKLQIQNVTEDEENPDTVTVGTVEWNIIDYNFLQNDYPTTVKIISRGTDVPTMLGDVIDKSGLFSEDKFSGVKNPFTILRASLENAKNVNGSVPSGVTMKIYNLLDQMGIKVFCVAG